MNYTEHFFGECAAQEKQGAKQSFLLQVNVLDVRSNNSAI